MTIISLVRNFHVGLVAITLAMFMPSAWAQDGAASKLTQMPPTVIVLGKNGGFDIFNNNSRVATGSGLKKEEILSGNYKNWERLLGYGDYGLTRPKKENPTPTPDPLEPYKPSKPGTPPPWRGYPDPPSTPTPPKCYVNCDVSNFFERSTIPMRLSSRDGVFSLPRARVIGISPDLMVIEPNRK